MIDIEQTLYTAVPRGGVPPHKDHLTLRQEWIWLWMLEFQVRNKRPPTISDVQQATGIASKRGAADQLQALVRKGFVTPGERNKACTMVAVDPTYLPTEKGFAACQAAD